MLGRHADAFFAKQASERVLAEQPNGEARSISFPDRETAGTGKVTHVSGHYEMPGPQRAVDANTMLPSMGSAEMLPSMGDDADFAPGTQPVPSNTSNMLPSMGAFDMGRMMPWLLGGIAVAGYLMYRRRRA